MTLDNVTIINRRARYGVALYIMKSPSWIEGLLFLESAMS